MKKELRDQRGNTRTPCGNTARPGGVAVELDPPPVDVAVDGTTTTGGASGIRRIITRRGVTAVTVDTTAPHRAVGTGRITKEGN